MFITLDITASLPCDFVLKDFTLSISFSEHDISYLHVSEEKTNQLLKISCNSFDYVRFRKWRASVIKFTFKVYNS